METKAKTIHELHEKFYGKKSKKKDIVNKIETDETKVVDVKVGEEKAEVIKVEPKVKVAKKVQVAKKVKAVKEPKVKAEKKVRAFKIRKNGVLRIGGNHIVDRFGFKKLQEFTIENPNPGVIVIKGK